MADRIIRAAGGIVFRDTPAGREFLLIFRRRYGDWSLPKGKRKAGETIERCAVREVLEETGYDVEITGKAGEIHYAVNGVPKIVSFFEMRAAGASRGIDDPDEVQEAVWMSPDDAAGRLTYALEREILARVAPF